MMLDNFAEGVDYRNSVQYEDTLIALQKIFEGFKSELEDHLFKEEEILFPFIRQLERHVGEGGKMPDLPCHTIAGPIRQMHFEHDQALHALTQMRGLTGDYHLPDEENELLEALYDHLQALEADLLQHIHLENELLFHKAMALEQKGSCAKIFHS